MIKFQIKIIVDKKGFNPSPLAKGDRVKKRTQPLKGFLSRAVSTLGIILSVLVLSTIIGLGIHLVFAWTGPSADPPGGNVAAPINVSSTAQTKTGSLSITKSSPGNWALKVGQTGGSTAFMGASGGAAKFGSYNNVEIGFFTNATTLRMKIHPDGRVEVGGTLRADGGFQVDGHEMVGSNADMLYANRKNTTGGGVWVSDDGGFYDYNDAYIDFRGDAGIRVLEWNGSWGDNSIRAAKLCIQNDCRDTWPSGDGGITCPDCDSRFVNASGDTMSGELAITKSSPGNWALRVSQAGGSTAFMGASGGAAKFGSYNNVEIGFFTNAANLRMKIHPDGRVDVPGQLCIRGDCRTNWPSGGEGIACPDCDSRFVNASGDTINGDLVVNNNVTVGGDLKADDNSWGSCYRKPMYGQSGWQYCDNGDYMTGVYWEVSGDAPRVVKIYCCEL